jgi:hypothetical protein
MAISSQLSASDRQSRVFIYSGEASGFHAISWRTSQGIVAQDGLQVAAGLSDGQGERI